MLNVECSTNNQQAIYTQAIYLSWISIMKKKVSYPTWDKWDTALICGTSLLQMVAVTQTVAGLAAKHFQSMNRWRNTLPLEHKAASIRLNHVWLMIQCFTVESSPNVIWCLRILQSLSHEDRLFLFYWCKQMGRQEEMEIHNAGTVLFFVFDKIKNATNDNWGLYYNIYRIE